MNRIKINATPQNKFVKFDHFFEKFKNEIISFNLTQEQTNAIFDLTKQFANAFRDVIVCSVDTNVQTVQNIDNAHKYIEKKVNEQHSDYRRLKIIKQNENYVSPVEKAVGFKWVQDFDEKTGQISRSYKQNTFMYVPILETIKSLFLSDDFVQTYNAYNGENKDHVCQENVYVSYCCGQNAKRNDLLKTNPNAVQIILYTDDFDPCDPLKSRAGKHKLCAFYMQIRNFPRQHLSKLSSIHLVALANSADMRDDDASINNILEVILRDLKILEKDGIQIRGGATIKGCLTMTAFDNLGANICYGLAGSFSATYFCRFCITPKATCKQMTSEDPDSIRDVESYNIICGNLSKSNNDLKISKGVKQYCILNDLNHFHMLENYTVDIMHDLLEGTVPFLLENLFKYCVKGKNLFSLKKLQNMVKFFDYGYLNKKSVPSKIKLEGNLGQSASQMHCLIKNIPFILFHYKNELNEVWPAVQSMLMILEIVFSEQISENDIKRLEAVTESHLKLIIGLFSCNLIPKHHLMLHYPRVIRSMGPLVHLWSMRFESKHKIFKQRAGMTKNFVNLTKSLAEKHQLEMSVIENKYSDTIKMGKITNEFDQFVDDFEMYNEMLGTRSNARIIKSLKLNAWQYRPGLLIFQNSKFFEIKYILACDDGYWFLCETLYFIEKACQYGNSLVLSDSASMLKVISLNELTMKKSFQKMYVNDEIHVICCDLELRKLCQI